MKISVKLYEHMAKELFAKYGIPIPKGNVAMNADEVYKVAAEIGAPVAVKSQVLMGGRGKAGGIKFADDAEGAKKEAEALFGTELLGYTIDRLLVEEKLNIEKEFYLGITVDNQAKKPLLIASTEGGVNIEEVPEKHIVKMHIDPVWGLYPYHTRQLIARLGLSGAEAKGVADIALKLYKLFKDYDSELMEINPLVISGDRVIAADGRATIDDDAMYRHSELPKISESTELEQRIQALGLAYVELDGDIAVMANGAGITMATIDVLAQYGGKAMNFLDAGGGASVEPMAQAIGALVSTNPRAILVNIFGGITRCDDVANAIMTVKNQQGIPVPLVVRLVGTNEAEGVEILKQNGIDAFSSMEEAAKKAVELASAGEGQ